jgi:hypothetical protein
MLESVPDRLKSFVAAHLLAIKPGFFEIHRSDRGFQKSDNKNKGKDDFPANPSTSGYYNDPKPISEPSIALPIAIQKRTEIAASPPITIPTMHMILPAFRFP